ncbi:putative 2-oxoglutarate-dependent dioxygenase [Porphyridium purpureum]|uniref:Putative 2-oxoglutarate-dependent dioxygenase n=1 Tax=Porphyridium purpureum TaxID=35688 RepID=A0A5J4YMP7_PORPP|nr:putative 2-oxoglutarate-dependent dioxygenase [Porphyridium purpureum]|eukprot:POR1798..scf249_10
MLRVRPSRQQLLRRAGSSRRHVSRRASRERAGATRRSLVSNVPENSRTLVPVVDVGALLDDHGTCAVRAARAADCSADHIVCRRKDEEAQRRAGEALFHAASQVGLFYVIHHGVPERLLALAREHATRFFDLPLAAKQRISVRHCASHARGFQQVGENVTQGRHDQHEALDAYREIDTAHRHPTDCAGGEPMAGLNQWPAELLPQIREFFHFEYVPAMLSLGARVMHGLALGMGSRMGIHDARFFEPYFDRSFWVLRLIRYPPVCRSMDGHDQGCGEHTDYGMLTILNQEPTSHHQECLEAQLSSGQWVAVPPIPGALAVNVGDMLEVWTGGRLRATPHRVRAPEITSPGKTAEDAKGRLSIPFFFEPNFDAVIVPLHMNMTGYDDSASVQDSKCVFKPIRYGDHLMRKIATNFASADPLAIHVEPGMLLYYSSRHKRFVRAPWLEHSWLARCTKMTFDEVHNLDASFVDTSQRHQTNPGKAADEN